MKLLKRKTAQIHVDFLTSYIDKMNLTAEDWEILLGKVHESK